MIKQRKRTSILCLGILLAIFITSIAWAESDNATLNSRPDSDIRIDGNNAVWMSNSNGNWDIYHLDISAGKETQITDDTYTQSYPDVWEDYIVWQDDRNYTDASIKSFDIYLYDIKTKAETKISQVEGDHREPIIENGIVVWVDHRSGNKDVMMYDISKKTLKKVSSDDAQAFGIVFDGSIIAWTDCRDGDFDIYLYDIEKKQEQQITRGLGDEVDPLVDNGRVVWMVEHNGYNQVYMYDTNTDYKTKLTVGAENHRPIAFSGDSLLIIEDDKLILNNVDSITDEAINSPNGKIPDQAFINDDKVIWFDGMTLTEESVDSALNRKISDKPDSSTGDTDRGNSSKVTENKDNRILIKANEDNIIKSEDGILTLKFHKGSFKEDTYLTLNQINSFYKESYVSVSPVYTWEIEENQRPLLPIEISVNYSSIRTDKNIKKMCLYTINEDNSLNLISSHVNRQESTLVSNIKDEDSIALMIYDKKFIDANEHWAQETIEVIASHHIIDGYNDNTFKPNNQMTRAEFVKILVSSICDEEEIMLNAYTTKFADVPSTFWGTSYINIASEKGWVSGDNGSFNPNQPITREQMVTILMRVYDDLNIEPSNEEAVGTSLSIYKDTDKISKWAYEHMEEAVRKGIIQGSSGELSPLNNATRAEAATILYRYLERLQKL